MGINVYGGVLMDKSKHTRISFVMKKNLSKHTKNAHKEKTKRSNSLKECHDCGKVFSRKDSLERRLSLQV